MATATAIVSFLVFANHAEWISPEQSLLPKADAMQCVGEYNGVISILGGEWNGFHDIITFDHDADDETFTYDKDAIPFTETQSGAVSVQVYGYSQYWTQIDNIMYMNDGSSIYTYDLSTQLFTEKWQTIPVAASFGACIASTPFEIYILGGRPIGSLEPSRNFQIYDIWNQSWSVKQKMNSGREMFSCIVSGNNLYAIGGRSASQKPTDTIEFITTSRGFIPRERMWRFSDDGNKLNEPLYGMRSIEHEGYIYVIGGVNNGGVDVDTVHIIQNSWPFPNVFVSDERLVYGVSYTTPIVVDNIIYVFGGSATDQHRTNKWQYYQIPTARYDVDQDGSKRESASNEKTNEVGYIGFGAGAVILASVLIGVVVWKFVCSRKGFKEYMNEKLTKEYGSTVPDEFELTERRL